LSRIIKPVLFIKDADLKKMGTVPFSPFIKEERDYPFFRRMNKVLADFMNIKD